MTENFEPHERDHQAPQYQQPTEHDSAYQPEPQGDAPQYQPHAGHGHQLEVEVDEEEEA